MGAARGPVILIHSQHAGHSAATDAVETALRHAGVAIAATLPVSALDEQPPQGAVWRSAGAAAVVAAGGDGTVGAVASHLAGSDVPLGILPLGTANDVARSLAIPLDLESACAVVASGPPRTIDLGRAIPAATEPGELAALGDAMAAGDRSSAIARQVALARTGAYFLHTLTLGLNVEFARLATDAARRRRWGPFTYAASAFEALTRFHSMPLTVRLEGVAASAYGVWMPPAGSDTSRRPGLGVQPDDGTRTISGEVIQFAAVVTPVFGGASNFHLPNVDLGDGLLDFVFVEALGPDHLRHLRERLEQWAHSVRNAAPSRPTVPPVPPDPTEVLALDLPGVWRFQAQRATILRPLDADVTLDGEIRGRTPAVVGVARAALRVLVPATATADVIGASSSDA